MLNEREKCGGVVLAVRRRGRRFEINRIRE
jgi:hypothetical protein